MSLALCDFAPQLRAGGALPVAPPFGAEPRAWPAAGASPGGRSVPGVAGEPLRAHSPLFFLGHHIP